MGLLIGGFFSQGAGAGALFTPNIIGRQQVNGRLSEALGEDEQKGPASAAGDNDLWIITTAGEVEVRINTAASPLDNEEWWNDASVSQGTPGATELVFELGERSDVTFNLFTESVDLPSGMTHNKIIANFTDDDQASFVTPSNVVRYGWFYDADADDPGNTNVFGSVIHQLTFRKPGFQDFVIRYEQFSSAIAINKK